MKNWYTSQKKTILFCKKIIKNDEDIVNFIRIKESDTETIKVAKRKILFDFKKISKIEDAIKFLKRSIEDFIVDEIDVDKYDLFVFDFDHTIVSGEYGANMKPPYTKKDENTIVDSEGNIIKLKPNVKKILLNLRAIGKDIGLISKSENVEVEEYENQPVILLLKEFGLLDLFNEMVVVDRDMPKSAFFPQDREKSRMIFIDDDIRNLKEVAKNREIDVFDATDMGFFIKEKKVLS